MKRSIVPVYYLLLFLIGTWVMVHYELSRERVVNWQRTYLPGDAIPFGTQVLYRLMPGVTGGEPPERISQSFYTYYKRATGPFNILYIADEIKLTPESVSQLLEHVSRGNSVFLSARQFCKILPDSLGVKLGFHHVSLSEDEGISRYPMNLSTHRHKVSVDTLFGDRLFYTGRHVFEFSADTLPHVRELGWLNQELVNFIEVAYGEGYVYLHTEPAVFSNFFLLQGVGVEYTEELLSYMPVGKWVWNEYHNRGRQVVSSPLRFIRSEDSLNNGYRVLMVTLVLFLLSGARRRQRAIPVIRPPENQSLKFLYHVRDLYLKSKNHKAISLHMIKDLKRYLQAHGGALADMRQEDMARLIRHKAAVSQEQAREWAGKVEEIKNETRVKTPQLFQLNRIIEKIKKQ